MYVNIIIIIIIGMSATRTWTFRAMSEPGAGGKALMVDKHHLKAGLTKPFGTELWRTVAFLDLVRYARVFEDFSLNP